MVVALALVLVLVLVMVLSVLLAEWGCQRALVVGTVSSTGTIRILILSSIIGTGTDYRVRGVSVHW